MSAHCAVKQELDWANDLAWTVITDVHGGTNLNSTNAIIADRLRVVFAKGELEGLKKAAQLAAVAADAVAETP